MTTTIEVARDRAGRSDEIIVPKEVARGVYIHNPPGAEALKLLLIMIKRSGDGIASHGQRNDMRLADFKAEPGMRNHTRRTISDLLIEIATTAIQFEDELDGEPARLIGGMVSHLFVDDRHEDTGDLLVTWWWGYAFARTAEISQQWAVVDKQTALAMRSRYAIALFIHASSLFRKQKTNRQEFDIEHLRKVLGVPDGAHSQFRHLKRKAIEPAIAEINRTSPNYELAATYHKTGRAVTLVTISWTEKPPAQKAEARAELDRHSAGRKHRQAGTAERISDPQQRLKFPESGNARFGVWQEKHREANRDRSREKVKDLNMTATAFREWCGKKAIPLDHPNIANIWQKFCDGDTL